MADMIILGENARYSSDSNETGLNNNMAIVGTSGSGKTLSVLFPCLFETYEDSFISPFPKRKEIDLMAPLFGDRGYRVGIVDLVNPMESDVAFDPLAYIRTNQDIHSVAEFIVKGAADKGESTHKDPYWDNCAISLLSALIFLAREEKGATFCDVYKLLADMDIKGSDTTSTSLDRQFNILARDENNYVVIGWWKTFHDLPVRTAGCIRSSLSSALDNIFTPELLEMISTKPSIRFEEIAQQKTALFIYTSAVDSHLNHFVKLFYSEAIKVLFEYAESLPGGKLPIPVRLLCDDFSNGGRIQEFPEYISIFREKGISATLIIQSESQLRSMYGNDDAVTILNNCDTYVYMGGTEIETCESVSRRANVPFEDILYMPTGTLYVFRRGQKPVRTERYHILEDERYLRALKQYDERMEVRDSVSGK